MKIQSRAIPHALIAVWKDALGQLSDATLRELAKARGLEKGFRPGKMPASAARDRLRNWLHSAGELPDDFRLALRLARPASALGAFLSEPFVAAQVESLMRAFGRAETLAALLIDEREALRDQALGCLTAWDDSEPSESERQSASADLARQLAPLTEALQTLLRHTDMGATASAASTHEIETTARAPRPQSERELVIGLRQTRIQIRQLQRELDASHAQTAKLKMELERITPRHQQAVTQAEAVNVELTELQKRFDEQVTERVQARLDERLLPWLAPAEQLAAAAAGGQGATLLERADALLERQAELDRRYGLRCQLQTELNDCRDRLARVTEARTQSLRPIPQLAELERALQARSAELLGLLAAPTGDEALPEGLDAALNSAQGLEALAALRQALQATEMLALLSEAQRSRAYARIAGTASRLYASAGGMSRTPALEREGLKNLPLYALQTQLAQGRAATLVVDGHNTLFMLPALFRPHFENGKPEMRARQALEQHLLKLARSQPRLSIQLWFDSSTPSQYSLADNLKVHFSGGSGDNRADDQIIAFLRHLQQASPESVRAVVTADRDEARRAESTGAMVMAPQELALWMA